MKNSYLECCLVLVFTLAIFSGQPGCNHDKHAYDQTTNTPLGTAKEKTFVPTDQTLNPPSYAQRNTGQNGLHHPETIPKSSTARRPNTEAPADPDR